MKMWAVEGWKDWPEEIEVIRETACYVTLSALSWTGKNHRRKKDSVYPSLEQALNSIEARIMDAIDTATKRLNYQQGRLALFQAKRKDCEVE